MARTYRLYQVDSFTKEKFTGNPAGVIPNADGLSDGEMQKIAREMNNSETAFVFSSTDESYDVHVRFFTPLKEVPICGHATIAAHYVRALENGMTQGRVYQKTGAGILPVDILRDGDDLRVIMTQGKCSSSHRRRFARAISRPDRIHRPWQSNDLHQRQRNAQWYEARLRGAYQAE